ncbi:hypothetical protein [Streptomyces sp. 6N223]|uniref:hypothetical protein n=1 Tax=Streptomyces sp. 6N223 TaxID=3457412 RepID=UPI003FD1BFC6
MKSPRTSRTPLHRTAVAAATALLALGLATPAAAAQLPVAKPDRSLPADAATPLQTASPITVTPSSGGAGTSVTVRVSCQPATPARSDAFEASIALSARGDGTWVGTGTIRSGLEVGRAYPVTVTCANDNDTVLSTNFTFTSATPTGGASAGFGGQTTAGGESDSQATALAVGGGVAIAGAVGYAFLARRRRSAGQHY